MKVTPAILQHELIGLHVMVVKSSNPNYEGIGGKVIDETHNTLIIMHKNKEKKVVKDVAIFHFTMPDGTVIEIDGKNIVGRPEDRIKKRLRRLW